MKLLAMLIMKEVGGIYVKARVPTAVGMRAGREARGLASEDFPQWRSVDRGGSEWVTNKFGNFARSGQGWEMTPSFVTLKVND